MIRELSGTRPLPVILKPVPDELLSSWITRHADFYGVAPLTMLRHAIPEAISLRQTDTNLGPTAAVDIARLFRTQPSTILAMTTSGFRNRQRSSSRHATREGSSALASTSLPFEDLWVDAVQGERLIDQSLTGASVGWVSPIDIVRLLLIRRCPKPVRHHPSIGRCTILGAVVPGFDELVAEQRLPSLRLQDRSCLLGSAWRCSLVSQSPIRLVRRTSPDSSAKRLGLTIRGSLRSTPAYRFQKTLSRCR